jgi:SRSO17 transposase
LTEKTQGERADLTSRQNVGRLEKIAKQHGVSSRTIERDAKFAKAVDKLSPEEKAEVLAGKSEKTKMETPGEMIRSGCLSPLNPPLS